MRPRQCCVAYFGDHQTFQHRVQQFARLVALIEYSVHRHLSRVRVQGISSKQFAHSAHRACPPAGTTRTAAIDSCASPHRRQIRSSPSQRASKPSSAIVAGSSITSTRTKLKLVSTASPVTRGALPNRFSNRAASPASISYSGSSAHLRAHSSNQRAWLPARPSAVPAE